MECYYKQNIRLFLHLKIIKQTKDTVQKMESIVRKDYPILLSTRIKTGMVLQVVQYITSRRISGECNKKMTE